MPKSPISKELSTMLDDLEQKAEVVGRRPWPMNCSIEIGAGFALKLVKMVRLLNNKDEKK
jgi:hypothetical protein